MKTDPNSPLNAKKEIIINAPVDRVWKTQSDIDNWPRWQKQISSAKILGELKKGTLFQWKAMGMNIKSELKEVIPNKVIGWSGKSIGMDAVHIWKFEKLGNTTRVITEESLSGWFPRLLKIVMPNFLEQSLSRTLLSLKSQAANQK